MRSSQSLWREFVSLYLRERSRFISYSQFSVLVSEMFYSVTQSEETSIFGSSLANITRFSGVNPDIEAYMVPEKWEVLNERTWDLLCKYNNEYAKIKVLYA